MDAEKSTLTFLQGLWPEEPLPGSLVVWTRSRTGESTSSWCDTLAQVVDVAARSRQDRDVYFGLALQDRAAALRLARREKPRARACHVRGFSESATAIPGLWIDVDFKAPVHHERNLPPDLRAALSLLEVVPHEPTLVVHSGFGIHAYWLFREPWASRRKRIAARRIGSCRSSKVPYELRPRGKAGFSMGLPTSPDCFGCPAPSTKRESR